MWHLITLCITMLSKLAIVLSSQVSHYIQLYLTLKKFLENDRMYFFFSLLKNWHEVSKVDLYWKKWESNSRILSILLRKNWQNLGANSQDDAKILSLDAWDNGSTIYRHQKTTVGCEIMGFSESSPLISFFK